MTDCCYSYPVGPHTLTARSLLLLLAGIVALSIGGWIYVMGRPDTLIYGLWHTSMAPAYVVSVPDFVLYSLPDGLWSLASILMLHPFLCGEPPRRRLAFIAVVPLLGVVSELLQGVGCLPGVFDIYDLACYALPLVSYILCQSFRNIQMLKS